MRTLMLGWVGAAGMLCAATVPVIGTVISSGAFRLNGDTVVSNGTLMDGAVLEAGRASSSVQLTSGARLTLSPASRGKFYGDRIILEKGETRLENGTGFHLEVLGLMVRPERGSSIGRVALEGPTHVRVAVLTGAFQVRNAHGVLVGNIPAGVALAFEPQAPAAAGATQITGTLTQQSGHFLLTDQVTHVTVEVTGQNLQAQVGQVVHVTGTLNASATPVAGASQVIAATSVQTVAGAAAAGGAATGAAAAATGGAAAGVGIGVTTVAIVGGVAVAAAVGGLAASGALSGPAATAPESR